MNFFHSTKFWLTLLLFLGPGLTTLTACRPASPPAWGWEPAEAGLPRQAIVLTVAVNPLEPRQLWAGYYGSGGLARSENGGQSWQIGLDSLVDNPLFDLLPVPAADRTVTLWAATRDGLLRSVDNGRSWQAAENGLPAVTAFALATDGSGRLYVGLDGHGLYMKPVDGRWRPLTALEPLASAAVLSLAVSADGRYLYAGTSGRGVLASADGGRSWVQTYPGRYAPNVVLNPHDPAVAVASLRDRLVRSRDGGQGWHTLLAPWGQSQVVSLLWQADGSLGAGTAQGELYRSLDQGDSWIGGEVGLPAGGVMDLAAIAQTDRLLAGAWTGLYSSSDGGQSWPELAPALGQPQALTLLTTEAGLLLGGQSGLFRWQAESQRWRRLETDFPSGIASLAADPANDQTLYAGTSSDGVFRSDDGGATWQQLPSRLFGVPALAVDPKHPEHLYLLAAWERVYESLDGGRSWLASWEGLGAVIETTALAVDPVEPVVYAGAETGLFRRRQPAPWKLVAPPLADQSILALLAQPSRNRLSGRSILHIGATRGVYRSLDWGQSVSGGGVPSDWGRGLENISVTALLGHPQEAEWLYAGTADAGVYQSLDGGRSWQAIGPTDLSEGVIKALAWSEDGSLFVVATGGVWRGTVNE